MGRKEGAQYQRRNIPEKAGSRAPTHSTANAVLLQQEARTQVCYKVPIASLSSYCPHNIALCVNSLYFENCSFSQQNCELNGEEFCPFNSSLQVREGTCRTCVSSNWFNYTFGSYWRNLDRSVTGHSLKAMQMNLAEQLKFTFQLFYHEV